MYRILFLLILSLSCALSQSVQLKPEIWTGENASVYCVYLTTGPKYFEDRPVESDSCFGFEYRVSFIVYEIYYSILIERINFSDIECMDRNIEKSFYFNSFSLSEVLNIRGELGSMEFLDWLSTDSFKVKINKKIYLFKIEVDGKCQIQKA